MAHKALELGEPFTLRNLYVTFSSFFCSRVIHKQISVDPLFKVFSTAGADGVQLMGCSHTVCFGYSLATVVSGWPGEPTLPAE